MPRTIRSAQDEITDAPAAVRKRTSVHDTRDRRPPARHLFESEVERYLVDRVERAGGLAYKFTSPNRRSVPDRIVLVPGRPAQFVELKAPGREPTQAQTREHARITRAGGTVWVIDTPLGVDRFIERMT